LRVKFIILIIDYFLLAKGDRVADVSFGAKQRAIGDGVTPPFVVEAVKGRDERFLFERRGKVVELSVVAGESKTSNGDLFDWFVGGKLVVKGEGERDEACVVKEESLGLVTGVPVGVIGVAQG